MTEATTYRFSPLDSTEYYWLTARPTEDGNAQSIVVADAQRLPAISFKAPLEMQSETVRRVAERLIACVESNGLLAIEEIEFF